MLKLRPKTDTCIIHCSGTKPSENLTLADIDKRDRQRGLQYGTGYHFIVSRDGGLFAGRPLFQVGAHTYGWNNRSVSVCLVGGLTEDSNERSKEYENNFTSDQLQSLETLLGLFYFLWPRIRVNAANRFNQSEQFPEDLDISEWLEDIRPWKHRRHIVTTLGEVADVLLFEGVDRAVPPELVQTPIGIIQTILNIPITGTFGSDTTAAVTDFQTRNLIPASGVVDALTWQKLLDIPRKGD